MASSLFGLFTVETLAQEQEESLIVVEQPAPPLQQEQPTEEVMPAPAFSISENAVHPAPPTKYRANRSARRMLRGKETIDLVMVARNPADGCLYEIPMCLPACCVGEPTVKERRGLGGRGVVEYCWECGFSATVKFRHRLGDVKVEYDGD
jgi:hypothetical protein